MTNPDYTHILLIVDRSGSMTSIADDMNGGITTMLQEQAALPGTLLVDAWTFDNVAEKVADNTDATDPVLQRLVSPRGSTALFDAVGAAVTDLGAHLSALSEDKRPGKVIVVIVTDGYENASREWTKDGVKKLLTQQQEQYAWQVAFLGANIDSATVGGGIGLRSASTMDYMPTAQGVSNLMASTSRSMSAYRTGATASVVLSNKNEEDSVE